MKYKTLNNGKSIPTIGLGTWLAKEGQVYNIVKDAIRSGYRHIDCAHCYENEHEIGKALEEVLKEGVVKREELFITSKLWNDSHLPSDVEVAIRVTLENLRLEYLDLYLMHWPVAFKKGCFFPQGPEDYLSLAECPVEKTYGAMEALVEKGLTKSIGVSNFSKKKLEQLIENSKLKPVMNQVELHPYLAQNDLVNFCEKEDIALTCYSPLGSPGRPTVMKGKEEPSLIENPTIVDIAKKYEKTSAQVILNWSLQRGTIVIPKTVTPARAIENSQALSFELSDEDVKQINSLDKHFRYVTGEFFTPEGGPYTLGNLWDE